MANRDDPLLVFSLSNCILCRIVMLAELYSQIKLIVACDAWSDLFWWIFIVQDIASDGCFSLGMIAHFKPTLCNKGSWMYPRLFWKTGVLGQVCILNRMLLSSLLPWLVVSLMILVYPPYPLFSLITCDRSTSLTARACGCCVMPYIYLKIKIIIKN